VRGWPWLGPWAPSRRTKGKPGHTRATPGGGCPADLHDKGEHAVVEVVAPFLGLAAVAQEGEGEGVEGLVGEGDAQEVVVQAEPREVAQDAVGQLHVGRAALGAQGGEEQAAHPAEAPRDGAHRGRHALGRQVPARPRYSPKALYRGRRRAGGSFRKWVNASMHCACPFSPRSQASSRQSQQRLGDGGGGQHPVLQQRGEEVEGVKGQAARLGPRGEGRGEVRRRG